MDPYYQLPSSCVTIPERLDISILKPDRKFGGKGMFTKNNWYKVPCEQVEDHVGARQVFPIVLYPNLRTSTVKHHCARTAVSASIRAMSNQVSADPIMVQNYKQWFRTVFIPEFLSFVDQEIWVVDYEAWLLKYPQVYRDKIRKAYDYENREEECWTYEAFAKIEQQFTEVPHILKETSLNTVKERQICGPQDQKKAMANAFIHTLELIAHKYQKEFCGRKNWIEICSDFDKISSENPQFQYDEEDFSGFDMTQEEVANELMNEFKIAVLNHPNIILKEPINKEDIIKVFENSLRVLVTVFNKSFWYYSDCRQSGDGWTTFDNTELAISYYKFTYWLAGVKNYALKCKGDDSIKGHSDEDDIKFQQMHKLVFTNNAKRHCHGLGQVIKVSKRGPLEHLGFLSNHFFLTDEGTYRMTRIPARVFQTLSWTTKLPKSLEGDKLEDSRRQLAYSKGKCLLAWGRGLPIWECLANKLISLGVKGKMTEYDQYADEARVWHNRDDRKAYFRYLERYQLTEADVVDIEERINNITTLAGFVEIPQVENFYNDIY